VALSTLSVRGSPVEADRVILDRYVVLLKLAAFCLEKAVKLMDFVTKFRCLLHMYGSTLDVTRAIDMLAH